MVKNTFKQFIKFLVVGANNTALDFLILNILMKVFNIYKGWSLIFLNSLSFSIAVTNSYFINRFWTFKERADKKIKNIQIILLSIIIFLLVNLKFLQIGFLSIFLICLFISLVIFVNFHIIKSFLTKENFIENTLKFGKFIFFTLVGIIINNGIVYIFTTFIHPFFGLSTILWANFSKALATLITLFWNFTVYKFIIFKV